MSWLQDYGHVYLLVGAGYSVGGLVSAIATNESHRAWMAEQYRSGWANAVFISTLVLVAGVVFALAWPIVGLKDLWSFWKNADAKRVFKAGEVDGNPCVMMRDWNGFWAVYSFCPRKDAKRLARWLERKHPEGSKYKGPKT